MNDQTTKFTTPSGKAVEIKNYITARERNEVRSLFFADMKVNATTGEGNQEVSGKVFEKSEEKLIETLVISFDNSSEKIIDRLLDGTPQDYDFVAKECDKIAKGNLIPAK